MEASPIKLDALNAMDVAEFVAYLRHVFEHSPWVIEAAASERPFTSVKALQATCEKVLYGASRQSQLDLIRAHPDLAAKLEQIQALTDFSQKEQARAGFAALPEATLDEMRAVLAEYREKFSYPFILCVSEHSAEDVLPILKARLGAGEDAERLACLFQIARIGWHRICSLVVA